MKFCSECGANVEGKKFCSECGSPVVETAQIKETSNAANSPRSKFSFYKNKIFVILMLVIVPPLGLVFLFLSDQITKDARIFFSISAIIYMLFIYKPFWSAFFNL